MSPVTCHQWQQPEPQILALLTPPLYTVSWLTKTKTKNPKRNVQTQKVVKTSEKMVLCLKRLAIRPMIRSLLVSVDEGGDRQTNDKHTNIATLKLICSRGRLVKKYILIVRRIIIAI